MLWRSGFNAFFFLTGYFLGFFLGTDWGREQERKEQQQRASMIYWP